VNKTLSQAIGGDEAETVQDNPTLAFAYAIVLARPADPKAHRTLDDICAQFGGMVTQRFELVKRGEPNVTLFTTVGGAQQLAQSEAVDALKLVAAREPLGLVGYELAQSTRSPHHKKVVPTKLPYKSAGTYPGLVEDW
jgi:hypothetical protein